MSKQIFVDADACPVRTEIATVATRHRWPVFVVSNGGIRPSDNPLITTIVVDSGPDVADDWIATRAQDGDIVITADIPLAHRCVTAGALVLKPNGEALTDTNIGQALAVRDLMSDLRSADPFRQGGGKGFGKADRSRFLDGLERLIRQIERTSK